MWIDLCARHLVGRYESTHLADRSVALADGPLLVRRKNLDHLAVHVPVIAPDRPRERTAKCELQLVEERSAPPPEILADCNEAINAFRVLFRPRERTCLRPRVAQELSSPQVPPFGMRPTELRIPVAVSTRDIRIEPADVVKRAFAIIGLAGDFVHHRLAVGGLRIPGATRVKVGTVDFRNPL